MMATLFTITDPRTKFCRAEMKANNGVWNPITQAWMFAAAEDAANALCALYQTTRPSMYQREALLEMAADGTGASAWDFDPATDAEWFERLDREKASALLAAGYAVRKLLGRHPLEDVAEPVNGDAFDVSEFEARAERARKRRRSA
jgi:hypothetical protein